MPKLPFEGIRVIDLSMFIAGSYATRFLADMGAEVIKIETVSHIDPLRGPVNPSPEVQDRFPLGPQSDKPYNCSAGYNWLNRNKYAITLDLHKPDGKDVFKRLVKISDIVLENYSPRVMSNFGLDYPKLKEINPQIIMMSMPALGSTGSDKDYIAFGQTIDCMSGMAYLTGYRDEEPMLQSGISYGDPLSGMNAAFAIITALHHRRKNGNGMYIELSQVEGVIAFNADAVMDYSMNKRVRERMGNRHTSMAPHGCYRCKGEDQWVVIAISSDEEWAAFCQVIGQPAWISDDRFVDVLSRYQHQDELDKMIEAWTQKYSHYEVMQILQKAKISAGPVLDAKELVEEPHLHERGFYETITHPDAGTHPYISMYAKFSKTPGGIRMPAPLFAEHNQRVFKELLGMSQDEISRLEEQGIIGDTPDKKQKGGFF